jgi:uncharacterized membrane protein
MGPGICRRFSLLLRLRSVGGSENDRGALAVAAAIVLTVLVFATALSLDIAGRVSEVRRDQATADMAALTAAWQLPLLGVQSLSQVNSALTSTACTNALSNHVDCTISGYAVTATAGYYSGGTFSPCGPVCVLPDAVKVMVTTPYNDFFGGSHSELTRTAVAQMVSNTATGYVPGVPGQPGEPGYDNYPGEPGFPGTPGTPPTPYQTLSTAQFSIGSTLAEVRAGLGSLGANLSAVGYQGLASGQVTLGWLATQLGFSTLTADQVLATNVTAGQLVSAVAGLLGPTNPAYANLSALASSMQLTTTFGGSNSKINLGQALGLQQGNGVGLGANVNLLSAVDGAIQLANTKAGIGATLGVSLPGLTDARFSLTGITPATISEPPNGIIGTQATSTAVTVTLTVDLQVTVGLDLVSVHLPLSLVVGGATGTLTGVDCTTASPPTVSDITVATAYNDVNATISGGSFSALDGLIGGTVTGSVPVTSAPVPTATVTTQYNWVTSTASGSGPVTVSSNLNGANANVSATLTLGSLSVVSLNAAVDTTLNSDLPTLLSSIGSALGSSSLGVNVGNADYLGIQAACAGAGWTGGTGGSGGSGGTGGSGGSGGTGGSGGSGGSSQQTAGQTIVRLVQ